ncbi:MAG: hypothetical protein HUK21_06680 [Fibrobacteraceae bacterium]|nr:hypothetical protein [Fibrobacteraceae bacterium]
MSDTKLYMGIEVGDASLKVALLDSAEKRVLKTAVLPTETSPIDDVFTFESVLQEWMDQNKIEKVESVAVTMTAFRSIVRQVYIPAEASANVDEYVKWYLKLITNADENAYILDYQVIGGQPSLGLTVLMIAVRKEWVDGLRKGFRNKALAPASMEVDVLSMLNLMDVANNIKDMECVIKADTAGVTMMWLSKDNLQCLRGVSTLSAWGNEKAYEMLAEGIQEQLVKAKDENPSLEVNTLRVCGELANDPQFVETLRGKVNDCQLMLLDSFSNLRLPVEAENADMVLSCVGAIGCALSLVEGV